MSSDYGRSGIRRSGDDYQDIVALEHIVDFLEHPDRYQWIKLEADDKGSLDDIVLMRTNESYELIQVKFSGYPEKESDNWTWEKLLEIGKKCTLRIYFKAQSLQ